MALAATLEKDGTPAESLETGAAVDFGPDDCGFTIRSIELTVKAKIDGHWVRAGNKKLMDAENVNMYQNAEGDGKFGTVVYIAVDGKFRGHLVISDEVKPDAAEAIRKLKELGVQKTVMLTGDAQAVGERVGAQLGLDEVHAQLLPADKVERVEALLKEKSSFQ